VVHGSRTVAPQALIKRTTGIARQIALFNIFPLARTAKPRTPTVSPRDAILIAPSRLRTLSESPFGSPSRLLDAPVEGSYFPPRWKKVVISGLDISFFPNPWGRGVSRCLRASDRLERADEPAGEASRHAVWQLRRTPDPHHRSGRMSSRLSGARMGAAGEFPCQAQPDGGRGEDADAIVRGKRAGVSGGQARTHSGSSDAAHPRQPSQVRVLAGNAQCASSLVARRLA